MSNRGSNPIPVWRDDPDYFPVKDARRPAHMAEIKRRKRIDGMVDAAVGDKSYSMIVKPRELA
jgi:hypothetical protein